MVHCPLFSGAYMGLILGLLHVYGAYGSVLSFLDIMVGEILAWNGPFYTMT